MGFLACSLLVLVFGIANLVWGIRMTPGRERDRTQVQSVVWILFGVLLTVAATYSLIGK
jgi:hypothetical protein